MVVAGGVYSVNLGSVNPINPATVPFDAQYYLGVKVGTDPEMTPRNPLTAVPYAFTANYALSASIGTGSITGSNIQDGTITNVDISPTAGIDFSKLSGVAASSHNHDATYVNEGQANSITSGMIVDGTITNVDISPTAGIDFSKLSGVAASSHNHDSTYVNEGQANSITTGMITDGQVTKPKLSASGGRVDRFSGPMGRILFGKTMRVSHYLMLDG